VDSGLIGYHTQSAEPDETRMDEILCEGDLEGSGPDAFRAVGGAGHGESDAQEEGRAV